MEPQFLANFLILKIVSIAFWGWLASPAWAVEQTDPASFRLLLAGGGVRTCSSMAPANCQDPTSVAAGRSQLLFKTDDRAIANVAASSWRDRSSRDIAASQLMALAKAEGSGPWSAKQLAERLKQQDPTWLAALDDRAWFGLLDLLEVAPDRPAKATEQVALEQSRSADAVAIYRTFVAMARQRANGKTPLVVVVTASARDPFEAADFYQQVFAQAGAQSLWLPLDAVLLSAQRSGRCSQLAAVRSELIGSFRREAIYPEKWAYQQALCSDPDKILDLLGDAQGLFINGGDQSLTRAAFIADDGLPAPWLTLIQQRLAANLMVVGGTSAGTAVMAGGSAFGHPNPMISNGESVNALARGAFPAPPPGEGCGRSGGCGGLEPDDLTYQPLGGLGLFPWAAVDTHFSQRGRHARLTQLLVTSGAPFGVGVDENSALLVAPLANGARLAVVGEHGVWLADASQSVRRVAAGTITLGPVRSHYLHGGDSAILTRNGYAVTLAQPNLTVPVNEEPRQHQTPTLTADQVFAGDGLLKWLTGRCSGAATGHQLQVQGEGGSWSVSADSGLAYEQSLLAVPRAAPRCSYRNLGLTFSWQADEA